MTGRHEGPPLGSAARDATAPPYHGKRRAGEDWQAYWFCRECHRTWYGAVPADETCTDCRAQAEEPARCWSCRHYFGDGCECTCCYDSSDGTPDEV